MKIESIISERIVFADQYHTHYIPTSKIICNLRSMISETSGGVLCYSDRELQLKCLLIEYNVFRNMEEIDEYENNGGFGLAVIPAEYTYMIYNHDARSWTMYICDSFARMARRIKAHISIIPYF